MLPEELGVTVPEQFSHSGHLTSALLSIIIIIIKWNRQ
jgi:hypothetical protein